MPSADPTRPVYVPTPRARLLNPLFDSYKLRLDGPFRDPVHAALPREVGLVPSTAHAPLKKLQARSAFNHLFAFPGRDEGLYVDEAFRLMSLSIQKDTRAIQFNEAFQLPQPTVPTEAREYPSIQRAGPYVLVSNGGGSLLLLRDGPESTFIRVATVTGIEGVQVLVDAILVEENVLLFLAYRMEEHDQGVGHVRETASSPPRIIFRLGLFSVTLNGQADEELNAKKLSVVEGTSAPYLAKIEADGRGFAIASSSLYGGPELRKLEPATQLPAPTHVLGTISTPSAPFSEYRWHQTGEDITVSIRVPPTTTQRDIHCVFTPTSIKCKLRRPVETMLINAALFDLIEPRESLWVLEDDARDDMSVNLEDDDVSDDSHGFRVVTLHLHKTHGGTRWDELLDPSLNEGAVVDETLDAAELAAFATALDKYTEDEPEVITTPGAAAAAAATVPTHPLHNAMTERSEEVDFEGPPVALTRFSAFSPVPTQAMHPGGAHGWLCGAFSWRPAAAPVVPLLCLRTDVDCLVYGLSSHLSLSPLGGFDALGFVHASKRDARFTAVTGDCGLAFVCETRGHVYVYAKKREESDVVADQYIVNLRGAEEVVGDAGNVVGFQQIGETAVLVLRERTVSLIDWAAPREQT
ncbi:NudC domain-containing protein 1 [Thoreauomyces humboldtii]|nr:NudC domain-containing protein 1 [Thoreauomyces humboldtii]